MRNLTLLTQNPLRTALALALVTAIPATYAVAPAPVTAAGTDLDSAVAALRGISTMQADFIQTDRNGQAVRGVMTLKRPGKIRFEYAKGTDMLIVSNGKSMYFVDYETRQVQRWPIQNSPLGALLDPNRDIGKFGRLVPTGHPDVVSIEVRDPKHPEYGVITLIFTRDAAAPGGLQLTHWVALDSQNHRTTVRLSNQRYGVAVSDSAFTFRDPRRTSGRPG